MAHQLLKDDGSYDRAAIVRRANSELRRARRLGLDWDRAKCLEYVWRQAHTLRAQFLGVAPTPVKPRKSPRLRCGNRASAVGSRRIAA
jgi:hypothetical protein